jgi:hypothetical protein
VNAFPRSQMSNPQIVTLARCMLLGASLVAAPAQFAAPVRRRCCRFDRAGV